MTKDQNEAPAKSVLVPMLTISGLFFMFGFVTWLNGSLIPFLQIACELTHFQAYFVTLAFYIAYTVCALPMSLVIRRTGYKRGLIFGLLVMMVGSLIFIPAANLRLFSIFLIALFVLGAGLTVLQAASNPYVVMIGPRESAAARVSILGILNKAAGVLAPLAFTALVLSDMSGFTDEYLATLSDTDRALALSDLSSRLVMPYLVMAGLLLAITVFVWLALLPEPEFDVDNRKSVDRPSVPGSPQLVLGAVTLFFYVGAEVIAGDTIGLFGKGAGVVNFGSLTSYTMGFMVLGYILGIAAIPRWISQSNALLGCAILGIVFSMLVLRGDMENTQLWMTMFSWTGGEPLPNAVLYVALLGFANALVWPAVWPLALEDLRSDQISTGSALLIMGIAGGAIIPLVYGALADSFGDAQRSYLVLLPCYAFILFYAVKGHKLRSW